MSRFEHSEERRERDRRAYIALMNRRNLMPEAERRQDIINETFAPVFNAFVKLPDCDGCKETISGEVICCQEKAE